MTLNYSRNVQKLSQFVEMMELELPVMADELEGGAGDAGHDPTARGFTGRPCGPAILFLDSYDIDFEDIGGGDDEVGDGAGAALGGPFGVEIVGVDCGDLGGEIGSGVGDVSGSAVLDPGRAMHKLEGSVAHVSWFRVFLGLLQKMKKTRGENDFRR